MKLIKYISFVVTIFIVSQGYAQSLTGQAYEFYKAKDYENALIWIDSAVTTSEKFDSQTWQLRGIIYRNIGGANELENRETAINSFAEARKYDSDGEYAQKINEYLKNTVIRYYNDAVTLLTEQKDLKGSEQSYLTYKQKYAELLDAEHNFDKSDIDYYNALGAEYLAQVDQSSADKKDELRAQSLIFCDKVIQIDSLDYQANFNSGIVYYNQGADYIMNQDPLITIDDLIAYQKKSETAFLKALPFLHRAEKVNPDSKEVIEALMGCYYGLNNNEKYMKYQTIIDGINLPDLLEKHRKNPKDKETLKELIRIYSTTLEDKEKSDYYRGLLNDLKND